MRRRNFSNMLRHEMGRIAPLEAEIDRRVSALYGLTPEEIAVVDLKRPHKF